MKYIFSDVSKSCSNSIEPHCCIKLVSSLIFQNQDQEHLQNQQQHLGNIWQPTSRSRGLLEVLQVLEEEASCLGEMFGVVVVEFQQGVDGGSSTVQQYACHCEGASHIINLRM